MILTPRFVFLHLHKSGGSFVNEALLRHEAGARQAGYHLPRSAIPPTHSALPVLGLVRSPWSYYVSWYAFQRARARPNALFGVLSDAGRAGFAATVRNLVSLGEDDALLDRVIAALPAQYTGHGLNLPGPALAPIRGTGLGFYSYLYRYLYGNPVHLHIARLEALRAELPRVMAQAGVPAGTALGEFLLAGSPRNVSAHGPPADYYDAELRALVARRDAALIERYGYSAEAGSPGASVHS
jgi:hypothetical protein